MSQVHDYSMWLTPERLDVEEVAWEESGIYRLYAHHVLVTADQYNVSTMIEIGCGTGWLAAALPMTMQYWGVDANRMCVFKARDKSARQFICADVRDLETLMHLRDWREKHGRHDLVAAFAFFKHFALDEWKDIVWRVLKLGRVGLFTMNVGEEDADDFEQGFAHTWVSMRTLADAVEATGHEIVSTEVLYTGETLVKTTAAAASLRGE